MQRVLALVMSSLVFVPAVQLAGQTQQLTVHAPADSIRVYGSKR
jgi:hypothetical protein